MPRPLALKTALADHVEAFKDRLIEGARQLIRIPSENTPPHGSEKRCQEKIAQDLASFGFQPDLYGLSDVPGLEEHPLYAPGRDYRHRPNLAARRAGAGGGRSLLLSGHIDTVPRGTQEWTADSSSGHVVGNRLYGRGSNDMKAGVAINLFVMQCVAELDLPLRGDLLFESIVDEEFGGGNGTLAGRLKGYNADAAIISEPSSLRICPAQRGGRTAHITFRAGTGGVLQDGRFPSGIVPQLTSFLSSLPSFASQRNAGVRVHEMYAEHSDPVPVSVTKVITSPWGYKEPITIPDKAQLEFYWQLMPGETQAEVEREFFNWLNHLVSSAPDIFPTVPEVSFPIRWLPGSSIAQSEPLVQELAACAETVLGTRPTIAGIEGPCDLYIFQQGFGIPAVLWGPRGANTHAADEYVEIDSIIAAAKTLLLFVAQWCATD